MPFGHGSVLSTLTIVFFISYGKCALPDDLSNYQHEYSCDSNVRLVRPLTIADVQTAVTTHTHVVPVGAGFSWNKEFFCASPPAIKRETAANIVMTTIRPLTIDVSEDEMSAWVSGGVTIWDLMVYLANYITPSSPRGYAIAAPPSFVNQTIAGAIATNTHGSSLTHGSLSNQVIGFKVVLANGSHVEIYPDSHPLYFKAFQVSVGRIGVVTDVKLKIVPETLVRRKFSPGIPAEEFLSELRLAQSSYRSTGKLPSSFDYDRLVILSLIDFSFMTVTLESIEEKKLTTGKTKSSVNDSSDDLEISQPFLEAIEIRINSALSLNRNEKGSPVADGVNWKKPSSLKITQGMDKVADLPAYLESSAEYFEQALENVSLETHEASFTFSEEAAAADVLTLQDGYEVAVPVDNMADCLQGIVSFLETEKPDNGFRLFPTLKFVGKEQGLLSASHDKPVMWLGLQDLVYYNQKPRAINEPFKRFMGYLVTNQACSPVGLHWGGAGWPDSGCWNGADVYKKTWCDFGCAVRALDPDDKFVGSAPDRWNWEGADLESCCTKNGYNDAKKGCECKVMKTRHSVDCPPAPFYSDR